MRNGKPGIGCVRHALVSLLVTLVACSSSDDQPASVATGGATVSAADGKVACYAACDTQAGLHCSGVPAEYGDECRVLCDSAYTKAPPECAGTRGAYDVCTRDRVTYACAANGSLSISPVGACASVASSCASCSSSAGASCWGLF